MKYAETNLYIEALKSFAKDKLYIAGAGKYGEILGKYFDKHQIPWQGYVDRRSGLHKVNEKNVYAYGEINDGYYVISSYHYKNEIITELRKYGVKSDRIIVYDTQKIFYDLYSDLVNITKLTKRVQTFYKKHVGKRCFIIGNGPSLKIEDLEMLKNEISFASNSIYALYKHTDWRPTYYCACDPIFCHQMMGDKEKLSMLLENCHSAFTSIINDGIKFRNEDDMKKLYYIRRLGEKCANGFPKFSTDCSNQVYLGGSITYNILQLAVYMGFRQIYLLGMDFHYSVEQHEDKTITKNNVCNHMEEIEQEEKKFYEEISQRYSVTYLADIDLQLAGYLAAKQYADSHGIEIYNATRGGKLEVFPRIDFDLITIGEKS